MSKISTGETPLHRNSEIMTVVQSELAGNPWCKRRYRKQHNLRTHVVQHQLYLYSSSKLGFPTSQETGGVTLEKAGWSKGRGLCNAKRDTLDAVLLDYS